MTRKDFYSVLNKILDECGKDAPQGKDRRPFLAFSWKKYYNRNNLNLIEVSKYKEIKDVLEKYGKLAIYKGLILHIMDSTIDEGA